MGKYNLHKTNLRLLNETVYNSQNCLLIFFNMEITRRRNTAKRGGAQSLTWCTGGARGFKIMTHTDGLAAVVTILRHQKPAANLSK
jgi:hypothetical protein